MVYTVGFDTSALDTGFKSHALRGIGRYVYELKRYFDNNPSTTIRIKPFQHCEFQQRGFINSLIDFLPAGRQTIRQQLLYPARLSSKNGKGYDILHFPAHMDAPAWSLKNYVLTVLDLIPLVLEDLYRANKPGWRFAFARWLEIRAIKNAALILAISENTARDVNRILGIPKERIIVTHLGVDERFFEERAVPSDENVRLKHRIPFDRKLLVYTGGIDPRKNYEGMLRTFAIVMERHKKSGLIPPFLAMAGEIRSDREFPRLESIIQSLGLEHDVGLLGFVPDDELIDLYSISSVFYFPSLYEGFGLPPLEAMAASLPVVSSNTSCMPEVLGDAALLVDPLDNAASAEAIMALLQNKELASDLRVKGRRRASQFPWSKTAEATLRAYGVAAKRVSAVPADEARMHI
ncbi:MAG: glycosyltransferase family 4 protein [Deltaproteobacteria bacterium]|nr:glycosyltransferase family 4 protein [Deltaproteobacteria bacterium]